MKILIILFSLNFCASHVNYYKVLGVGRKAREKEINKNYKMKLKKLHPDRYSDPKEKQKAQEEYTLVQEAYEILSDVQLKAAYDYGGMKRVEKIKKNR